MIHCSWQYRTIAYTLGRSLPEIGAGTHIKNCSLCKIRVKFVEARLRRFSRDLCPQTVVELHEGFTGFEEDCVIADECNRRFVVKQSYCFCGARASMIPLPLREGVEQRANSECSACGARWRVAHCCEGCGAPLDDRFDELCEKCRWIKCPAGHCSNADCDD